jgi:hypothetical protein
MRHPKSHVVCASQVVWQLLGSSFAQLVLMHAQYVVHCAALLASSAASPESVVTSATSLPVSFGALSFGSALSVGVTLVSVAVALSVLELPSVVEVPPSFPGVVASAPPSLRGRAGSTSSSEQPVYT